MAVKFETKRQTNFSGGYILVNKQLPSEMGTEPDPLLERSRSPATFFRIRFKFFLYKAGFEADSALKILC